MPTLASTSRAQLGYVKETVYGTTPGAGNGRYLRMTGESLNFDLSKEESKEIRDDRQVSGATTVDANAAGSFNFHLQYNEYDELIEGALGNSYTVFGTNGVSATATITFAAGTLTASVATSGSSDWSTLQRGQWFRVNAPGNAANDGKWYRVSTTVAPTSTVITLDAGTPAVAAAAVANCTIATSRVANGVTLMSFSLEKKFSDVGQFFTYRGMGVSKMNMNFSAGAISDGSFEFMGKDMVRNTATQMPGSIAASKTYEIQNGVRGMGHLWEGTTPLTSTSVKSMTMNVDNNLRGQKALGTLGNIGLGQGDFAVTGTMECYFADGTQVDKFLADTYTQLILGTKDTSNNGYVYTLPRVLLMNAKIVAGGKNQDAMVSFDYRAFSDDANAVAALRKTMFIDRLGVAAP
jgi:hypothetical protein